jgi:hypothetical protein
MGFRLVASTSAGAPSGGSVTSPAIDTTGANWIVVHRVDFGGAFSISDSYGNAPTDGPGALTEGFMTEEFLYYENPAVGPGHTFTLGNSRCAIVVMAFAGIIDIDYTGPSVQNKSTGGIGGGGGTGFTTGAVTPTAVHALIIAGLGVGSGGAAPTSGTIAVSGGSLAIDEVVNHTAANNQGNAVAFQVQSGSPAAVAATWSWTGTTIGIGTIAVFLIEAPVSDPIVGTVVCGAKGTVTSSLTFLANLDNATRTVHEPNTFVIGGKLKVLGTTDLGGAVTVPNDSFTNAKLADMAQSTIKGRAVGAGTGDPTDLTATQATAILNNVVGDSGSGGTKGLVPAPAAGDAAAGKFLKADGTFAVPGGSSSDSFKTIVVSGQSDVVADSATDTLTLVAGTNVTITTNAGTDTITLAASGGSGDSTTTAAQASRPAASNDGNVFFPSDGVTIQRDTGSVWAPWGPIFPLTAPVDGDFAWVNQGGASVVSTFGGIFLRGPAGSSLNLRVRKKAAPSTPYVITVALKGTTGFHLDNQSFGLVFRNNGAGTIVTYLLTFGTPGCAMAVSKWNSETSFSANYVARNITDVPLFLRIADNGTNRISSLSHDGQNFIDFHTVGRTDFLTADEVGFFVEERTNAYDVGLTVLSWKET